MTHEEPGTLDVAIVGGCGRVGLPLGGLLADSGLTVGLLDVNEQAVASVNRGRAPFFEPGLDDLLARVQGSGRLTVATDTVEIDRAEIVIVVIGTASDEHDHADTDAFTRALDALPARLRDGQLLVLRSTVEPGVTARTERSVERLGLDVDVAYCPERIAEGRALTELRALPQIIGARNERAASRAAELFRRLTPEIVYLAPEEAELAKLFSNAWRYIKFATANQLYMIATDLGLDYGRIREAMVHEYPRAADIPGAGFAAGPCLANDTLRLAPFADDGFALGRASVTVNQGLPRYLVERLARWYDFTAVTVGILGMAFKSETDDIRSSLSYELARILRSRGARVLGHDPYVTLDADLVDLATVLAECDLLIIGAPHTAYRDMVTQTPVVDIWNLRDDGVRV